MSIPANNLPNRLDQLTDHALYMLYERGAGSAEYRAALLVLGMAIQQRIDNDLHEIATQAERERNKRKNLLQLKRRAYNVRKAS
jgi:hypothetical protein